MTDTRGAVRPRDPDDLPEIDDQGEVPCAICRVTWPPEALDIDTHACPDCMAQYGFDLS